MVALEDILAEADKNGRVCPLPMKWNELWEKLPNRMRRGSSWEPAPPLILAAWWDSSVLSKKLRFQEHLRWAEKQEVLDKIYEFLKHLEEDQWYHGE